MTAHAKCVEAAGIVISYIPMMDEEDYAMLDPIMGVSHFFPSPFLPLSSSSSTI
jgi:hypothetical protein